ncbi:MAG: DNA polymerase III subunit delta [Paludibacteraceae bacterium]|nr:DNA polymerase III subunit delta [Paludibacteraceae bacterium]
MQFKDIIGQNEVKQRLRLSVTESRIPHAQLFFGQEGVGSLSLAIAYAQYIACEHRTENDSCGQCPSCLQYRKLQHPDLHFAFPVFKEKTGRDSVCDDFIEQFRNIILQKQYFSQNDWYAAIGAENKQGVIYEAESSEILRKLSLKSFSDGYKTMIIWLPEKMHTACANKLLKIIEEPPVKTLFLLVTQEPERLLPTILSRTQQIHIPNLSEEEIKQALLSQNEDLSTNEAKSIAHIANGSWLRALQTLSQTDEMQQNLNMFTSLFRNAWSVGRKKSYEALFDLREWCSQMAAKGREVQKIFLVYAQNQIRENYIRNLQQPQLNYQTLQEAAFSERFAPFINERNVEQLLRQFTVAQQQIEQNGNAKIIFFDLCLQTIVLIKK